MQFLDILCVVVVFALSLFAMIGGYILRRQKHWNRVWEKLGKPGVSSIKELKTLNNRQRKAEKEASGSSKRRFENRSVSV